MSRPATLRRDQVAVGDALPGLDVPITATAIVSGAIASRDYQDVHHDRDRAVAQGSKDIFMNILTTNGYVGRYVSDWAGPEALIRCVDIRLGIPNYPGDTMRFSGEVTAVEGDVVTVAVRGSNDLGDHVTGTVHLSLPEPA
ncbi:MAG: MaoC family dehydratase [Myxococcota bacterium]